jgi:hypothetical protein
MTQRLASTHRTTFTLLTVLWCLAGFVTSKLSNAADTARTVSHADMQAVYDEVKTPHKYGIVLRPSDG